jgi:RNA polymerase sigma factor (sigma-70 family)
MAGRDEAEFEAFAARDGGRLLGFALLLTARYQDAEDLVQIALLRSAGRWPAARENPEGYTRAILVNLAKDRWRRRQRRQDETLVADAAGLPWTASGAAVGGSAAGRVAAGRDLALAVLDRQALLGACRTLPVRQRAVLVLRFWEDRSVEETAAVLGCTAGTVKSQTHRALARLRAELQEPPGPATGANEGDAPC